MTPPRANPAAEPTAPPRPPSCPLPRRRLRPAQASPRLLYFRCIVRYILSRGTPHVQTFPFYCAGRGGHGHFGAGGGGRHGFFGGPFGGGGFRGGGGMRTARVLGSGDLQLLILLLLSEKPRHGYEIIKAIEEHSSGVYTPSPGMVYPALTYLEETGYATAAAEGTKKLFSITAEGADAPGEEPRRRRRDLEPAGAVRA